MKQLIGEENATASFHLHQTLGLILHQENARAILRREAQAESMLDGPSGFVTIGPPAALAEEEPLD